MDAYDAIALTLHADDDRRIAGRTAMQKLVYFHSEMIDDLGGLRYVPHFFGPFSRDVSVALEEMTGFAYIDQSKAPGYYEAYVYRLTDAGIAYAKNAAGKYPVGCETIRSTVRSCDEHCGLQQSTLSYAAKAHYILANTGPSPVPRPAPDAARVAKEAGDFGWCVSEEDAGAGIRLLERLGLVSD